MERF
jgi:hypothetical protein